MFKLKKVKKDGVRLGILQTPHGKITTPFYMPDATRGFIKHLTPTEIRQTGTSALVVNTFHLHLQPGEKIIAMAGGIHKFMNWSGPILSDSGGFQVFSLIHKNSRLGKVTDDRVIFKSPLDGREHELTPEKSIQIQFDLGVDMMVCLDDCPPNEFSRLDIEKAVNRTIAWAARCKKEYEKQIRRRKLTAAKKPLLFAVIQGGEEIDLRQHCAQELIKIGFAGYSFGARHVNEQGKFLEEVMKKTASFIPETSPRFALGVGLPSDIERAAKLGWDMFDCVIPTREGRHGKLYTEKKGKIESFNINRSEYSKNFKPINKLSQQKELQVNSLIYLHHLFKLKEGLGQKLASLNNLEVYQNLLKKLRK